MHTIKNSTAAGFIVALIILQSLSLSTLGQCPDDLDGDGYHDGDVAVLEAIKANNDPGGNLNWTGTDYGSWERITWSAMTAPPECISTRRVTDLILRQKSLAGTLVASGLENLKVLVLYQNSLDAVDVAGLTNLVDLNCYTNQITGLDITTLTSLQKLDCHSNAITTLNASGLTNLQTVTCYENQLTELDLSGNSNLTEIYCDHNQITLLNTTGLTSLLTLECYNNSIAILDFSSLAGLTRLKVEHNRLPISLLKGGLGTGTFTYAPQDSVLEHAVYRINREVDYSAEAVVSGSATQFTWKKSDGTLLVEGTDYTTHSPGVFIFSLTGSVYCEMTNPQLPDLSGVNLLVAKVIDIVGCPDDMNGDGYHDMDVQLLEDIRDVNNIGSMDNWNSTTPYDQWLGVSWTTLEDDGSLCGVARRITGIDVQNKGLYGTLVLEGMDSLTSLNMATNKLEALNTTGLLELDNLRIQGNELTTIDVSENVNLTLLDISGNLLTSITIPVPGQLQTLKCQNNILPFTQLEQGIGIAGFEYAPQDSVFEYHFLQIGEEVDYSREAMINGSATTYSWEKASDGTLLAEGVDYQVISDGIFSFLTYGSFYCEMTNDQLPDLSGDQPLTAVKVDVVCSLDQDHDGFHDGDVAILESIRTANDGAGKLNWTGTDYITWDGVTWEWFDVEGCTSMQRVTQLALVRKSLTGTLNPEGLDELMVLNCQENDLAAMELTGLYNLELIDCHDNLIESLQVNHLDSLKEIQCYNNNLLTLDISGLDLLHTLACYENALDNLVLTGTVNLETLYCDNNNITALDLSGLNNISRFNCAYNQLEEINILNLTKLIEFECSYNQLDTIHFTVIQSLLRYINWHNRLPISQLRRGIGHYEYIYAPQDSVFENRKVGINVEIDYNTEAYVKETATLFTWINHADGSVAVEGTDYIVASPGTFKFQVPGLFHIEMSNTQLPELAGDNIMRARSVLVTSQPVLANPLQFGICNNETLDVPSEEGVLSNDTSQNQLPLTAILVTDVSNGTLALNSDGSFAYTADEAYSGSDSFTYKPVDGVEEGAVTTIVITVNPVPDSMLLVYGDTIQPGETGTITIEQSENQVVYSATDGTNEYSATGNGGALSIQTGSLEVTTEFALVAVSTEGCGVQMKNSATIVISTGMKGELLPQGFSPNGDGINDYLEIPGLEAYPDNELIVFNRWGHIVYRAVNYQQDWNGKAINKNKLVPEGTYYYILKLTGVSMELKSFVYINY